MIQLEHLSDARNSQGVDNLLHIRADQIVNDERVRSAIHHPATTWPILCRKMAEAVWGNTRELPVDDQEIVRMALSAPSIAAAMTGLINTAFIDGFDMQPDTWQGWVTVEKCDNFLPQHAFTLFEAARLTQTGKGQEADQMYWGVMGAEGWALSRYATQFNIDEQDLFNSQSVDARLRAYQEMGRAAARLPAELLYTLLLSNPTMAADGNLLFSAAHGNYASGSGSALSDESLDAGLGAIGKQVMFDAVHDPVHLNLRAKYLVCAPELLGLARRLARHRSLDDGGDLTVIPESRLSAIGCVNPVDESVVTGFDTAWLLACPKRMAPSFVLGSMGGELKPRIRQYDLGPGGGGGFVGQWGKGFDILLDVGGAALDWRPVYFSAGQ